MSVIPTEKKSIAEFGDLNEVAANLTDKVLTPSTQKAKVLETSKRVVEGVEYYSFEFEAQAKEYTRHALGVVAVGK